MEESNSKNESNQSTSKELRVQKLEAWFGLLKSFAWPLVALLFFSFNCTGIRDIINEIPKKLKESDKVSVGSLSLEITKKAEQLGNPKLGELTKDLSAKAIEQLLTTGTLRMTYLGEGIEKNIFSMPNGELKAALLELNSKGLLNFEIKMSEYDDYVKTLNLKNANNDFDENSISYEFTPEQIEQNLPYLKRQSYYLSTKGTEAFNLVIAAIKSNIKTEVS